MCLGINQANIGVCFPTELLGTTINIEEYLENMCYLESLSDLLSSFHFGGPIGFFAT